MPLHVALEYHRHLYSLTLTNNQCGKYRGSDVVHSVFLPPSTHTLANKLHSLGLTIHPCEDIICPSHLPCYPSSYPSTIYHSNLGHHQISKMREPHTSSQRTFQRMDHCGSSRIGICYFDCWEEDYDFVRKLLISGRSLAPGE